MSLHAINQQTIRDAAAEAVREATGALEGRITALEEQLLSLLQPSQTAEDVKPSTRKARGTTASAGTAAASGTSS